MNRLLSVKKSFVKRYMLVLAALLLGVTVLMPARTQAAACAAPATDYGTVTNSFTVAADATYRIWSRIMAPDTTNNTYLLEIDGATCYTVGGGSEIPADVWTWVDYQNGNTASKIDIPLSKGAHTARFIGAQPNVKLDRVVAFTDLSCKPQGNGDSCAVSDTEQPKVSLVAPTPAEGSEVSGTVEVTAAATDNRGVAKVEFYVDGALIDTDSTSPYSTIWNTTELTNGTHEIVAKAYDTASVPNVATSDVYRLNVKNGDVKKPTPPEITSAKAISHNKATLAWNPSQDESGVANYLVKRYQGGLLQATITLAGTARSYEDGNLLPKTEYAYEVMGRDGAGNISDASKATITTPAIPDTEKPVVVSFTAVAKSQSQVDLAWNVTDAGGIEKYEVYRKISGQVDTKVPLVTVTTTTLVDGNGLSASTKYVYYLIAYDKAGNNTRSSDVVVTTPAPQKVAVLKGVVSSSLSGKPTGLATVELMVGGKKRTASTNSRGEYTISNVPAGTYSVTYRKGSTYEAHTISVYIKDTTVRNVTLKYKGKE